MRSPLTLVVYHRDGIDRVPLQPAAPVVIGRTDPSDVRPRSRRLSRRHASFELRADGVWVEDLESTNGTFLNGEPVRAPVRIGFTDRVELGSVTVAVHRADEPLLRALVPGPRFDEEVAAGLAGPGPVAVAVFRARNPSGPALGAWIPGLARLLGGEERATLRGPDALAVCWVGPTASTAAQVVQSAVEGLASRMPLSAGLATWRGGPPPPEDLAAAAHAAAMRCAAGVWVEASTPPAPPSLPPVREERLALGAVEPGRPIVRDPSMVALYQTVDRVASSMISVLVVGETGTGKELIARALHERSDRRAGPWRVINCGAIPANLLESTLFGHERGAFTGADRRRIGVFEEAGGGTVFLDEIGELPLLAQVALLRVLESRRIQRVGAAEEIPVDVRVVAATHRDLEAMCDDGSFRWDLLYRLNGITLRVPPLRDRPSELRSMVESFVAEANRANGRAVRAVAADALAAVQRYRWPGNIRELRNAIERAVVVAEGDTLLASDLPERVGWSEGPKGPAEPAEIEPTRVDEGSLDLKERVRAFEIRLIEGALREAGGNQTRAAALLAIPRRTLVYKLRAYTIRDPGAAPGRDERLEHVSGPPAGFLQRVQAYERQIIARALALAAGDPGEAARRLNIQRRTLAQKVLRYGPLLADSAPCSPADPARTATEQAAPRRASSAGRGEQDTQRS